MSHVHTLAPWFVIPDPAWQGRHPYHEARYVATCSVYDLETRYNDDATTANDPPMLWNFCDPKDSIVCTMPDSPQQMANARLIAAAPELLEACKRALTMLDEEEAFETCKQLTAAIRKAEEAAI